jgi:hypothetical protein
MAPVRNMDFTLPIFSLTLVVQHTWESTESGSL